MSLDSVAKLTRLGMRKIESSLCESFSPVFQWLTINVTLARLVRLSSGKNDETTLGRYVSDELVFQGLWNVLCNLYGKNQVKWS